MEFPYISVIVPVYNGEKIITECIQSLLNLDYPKEKLEIIIVDNNSNDNTKNIIKNYPVKYLFERKSGSYNARNMGIKNSNGEILAFTDSDCIADKNWIKYLIRNFNDPRTGGVGGNVIAFQPESIVEKYQSKTALIQENFVKEKPPYIVTANAAYPRDALIKIGLFDGSLYSGGDADIGWRLHWAGYEIKYEPNAVVYHKHRSTIFSMAKQYFKYGMGYTIYFKKNRERLNKRTIIDVLPYIIIFKSLFMRFPWRLLNAYRKKKDKLFYISVPIYKFIEQTSYKFGLIVGSIKNRVICL